MASTENMIDACHNRTIFSMCRQWRNRRGAGGAECPPRLLTGKFLTYWEKSGKEKMEKGENGEEKKENCEREGGKLKMGGKSSKMRRGLFFFFLLFTFQNNKNLFWVYQNGNFLP